MSRPAAQSPQHKGAGGAAAAASVRQLDCQSCFEPFSPVIGPRYPRILAPCAHTFCTECISNQLKARGADDFRCLTHNQSIQISKAEDVKANFALIELLELIEKDADHQVVDERTKPPSCSECDEPSVWYCKNDEACFCDAHRISCHSSKAQSTHAIIPVADRTAIVVPKCATHKSKDLELWCTQCSALCCTMCERSGTHKEHADKLVPVDDVVITQRAAIERLAAEATELSTTKLDKEAQSLIALQSDYEASARRVREELAKQQAEIIHAVESRFAVLHAQAQAQLSKGLKHIALRVDDLTMSRSRAAMVSEEAARVLRMSDHAVLAHTESVEQNMVRARKGWTEYQLSSLLPQPMELRSEPQLLFNEIAVAGLIDQPWVQVDHGKPSLSAQPVLAVSAHRSDDRVESEHNEQSHLQRQAQQLDQIRQLEKQCADGEQQRRALDASVQQRDQRDKSSEQQSQRLFDQLQQLQQVNLTLDKQLAAERQARAKARAQNVSDVESTLQTGVYAEMSKRARKSLLGNGQFAPDFRVCTCCNVNNLLAAGDGDQCSKSPTSLHVWKTEAETRADLLTRIKSR